MIYLCAISNIRSGACNEDCKFCTQSVKWNADIKRYKQKSIEDIVTEAKIAKKNKAVGFCLVTSGKELDEKTLEYIIKATKAILKEVDIEIIACNGIADIQKLKELKKAGVNIYNHNLETSKEYYSKICSTHAWEDRFKTCENVKKAGLRLCSGGIFGMGESEEDINSIISSLKELNPEGIALNFFIENKNLPLKATHNKEYALKIIKSFKKIFKNQILMLAGGRELLFKNDLLEAIKAGVNSIVIGDYLTTTGEIPSKDLEYLKKYNIKIANEC
jgi:biotin synthase